MGLWLLLNVPWLHKRLRDLQTSNITQTSFEPPPSQWYVCPVSSAKAEQFLFPTCWDEYPITALPDVHVHVYALPQSTHGSLLTMMHWVCSGVGSLTFTSSQQRLGGGLKLLCPVVSRSVKLDSSLTYSILLPATCSGNWTHQLQLCLCKPVS